MKRQDHVQLSPPWAQGLRAWGAPRACDGLGAAGLGDDVDGLPHPHRYRQQGAAVVHGHEEARVDGGRQHVQHAGPLAADGGLHVHAAGQHRQQTPQCWTCAPANLDDMASSMKTIPGLAIRQWVVESWRQA